ncbi:hypothetical protein CY35_01G074600 [Sphagnum magellanicum]|nr:hypothetical protein CY35_01G074600 [Sphagnum magellanicum]
MAASMLSRNLLQGVDLAPTVAAVASPALNGDLRAAPPVSYGAWRLGRNRCGALSFVSPAQGLGFGLERMRRSGSEKRGVVTMVAVPVRPVNLPTEREKREAGNLGEEESEEEREFDPSALPPFTLAEIRAAIPKHCWEKNPWKSMSFVARDVAIVFGLAAGAAYLNTWFVWPLYWLAQGTMFWALFVLGHDCGHGSFSNNKKLNSLVGHLTHSSILVPYHGWRISHRTHHQNHGHVENDESWHPISETIYKDMDFWAKKGRLSFPWAMLAYPFYLWSRSPGKRGSHFHPESDLFVPNEAKDVMTSTACWTAMLATLVALTFVVGPMWMLKLYVMPYWVIPPTVMVGAMMCLELNGVVKDHLLKHPQLRLPRNFNS